MKTEEIALELTYCIVAQGYDTGDYGNFLDVKDIVFEEFIMKTPKRKVFVGSWGWVWFWVLMCFPVAIVYWAVSREYD